MRVLLDTCALLWLAGDQSQLTAVAKKTILGASALLVSDMSAWEIGTAVAKKRIALEVSAERWFEQALARYSVSPLPVTWRIAIASTRLPPIHSDPCDRIIIATAISEEAAVISADQYFAKYPEVQVRW